MINPTYDYLEIKKFGIYGKIKDNKVIETGKILIVRQDSSQIQVKLKSNNNDSTQSLQYFWNIVFKGKDSILMFDASVGCGTYYNIYRRKN